MTKNEWRSIFCANLRDAIEDSGMSQKLLAKECNLSTGSVSDYINGWSVPGVVALVNISYALDISIDELVNVDELIDY